VRIIRQLHAPAAQFPETCFPETDSLPNTEGTEKSKPSVEMLGVHRA
jgi:hypothetical protein